MKKLYGRCPDGQRVELSTLDEVADFIVGLGMEGDLYVNDEYGTLMINTFGPFIDKARDQAFLRELLPVLIPKQQALENSIFGNKDIEEEDPEI